MGVGGVRWIFRYVDDFLIVYDTSEEIDESLAVARWQEVFLSCCGGLNFTVESHERGVIHFSDLRLMFSVSHVRSTYEPRS